MATSLIDAKKLKVEQKAKILAEVSEILDNCSEVEVERGFSYEHRYPMPPKPVLNGIITYKFIGVK